MKKFFQWITKHLSTVFSVLGVTLTIYFSVFYLPNYIKELQNEKIKLVNDSIINGLQEQVYNENNVDLIFLKSLIRGKELKHKIHYPYSIDEILDQTKENFFENKYLNLQIRNDFNNRIELLRQSVKKEQVISDSIVQITDEKALSSNLISNIFAPIVGAIIGILVSLLGLIGIYRRSKAEKDLDVVESIIKEKSDIVDIVSDEINLKYKLVGFLTKIEGVDEIDTAGGWDITFNFENSYYAIEFIFSTNKSKDINTSKIHSILNSVKKSSIQLILVDNQNLNKASQTMVENQNMVSSERTVYLIKYTNLTNLKIEIESILSNEI